MNKTGEASSSYKINMQWLFRKSSSPNHLLHVDLRVTGLGEYAFLHLVYQSVLGIHTCMPNTYLPAVLVDETTETEGHQICLGAVATKVPSSFTFTVNSCVIHALSFSVSFVSVCRATAVQSPPSSCSFRALLEEEENRLIRVGQTGTQRGHVAHGAPVTPTPTARRVTFKCAESSEPERHPG